MNNALGEAAFVEFCLDDVTLAFERQKSGFSRPRCSERHMMGEDGLEAESSGCRR